LLSQSYVILSGEDKSMEGRDIWWKDLRQAAAESSTPRRNWRWMLASLGIGAGMGLVAGLFRLGAEPARFSQDVALTTVRAAVFFFGVAWLVVVGVRFGRRRRS
jgi:hypothetical protein